MKNYTEILKKLRAGKNVNQIEVANLLGTSQQHYSKYETGEYELPLRALYALADYYNVSADYIMGRTDCREGVTGLNRKVDADCTAGEVISDILSLDTEGRAAVLEYIYLQKIKKIYEKEKKDGSRT